MKKKISIITILDNFNFGTYLQAYATAVTIENLGAKPEIVAYSRPGSTVWEHYISSIKTTLNPIKWFARTIYAIREYNLKRKDLLFVSKYLTAKKYYSFEELKTSPPDADIYMTGSDQVWNSMYNHGIDYSFYLEYAPLDKKRVSYAASIGMEKIPKQEKDEMVQLLSKYDTISLRELSSVKLLNEIGIDKRKLKVVIDPTLLLDKKSWKTYAKKRMIKEPYLIVYSVEPSNKNKEVSKIASFIAKQRGLKVIGVYYGGISSRISGCDRNFYYSTPAEFLSLLLYSSFAVVSSFHGTAFAINFQKEFITITPEKFNSRTSNLLRLLSIDNRQTTAEKFDYSILKKIDYRTVHKILKNERNASIRVLKKLIN